MSGRPSLPGGGQKSQEDHKRFKVMAKQGKGRNYVPRKEKRKQAKVEKKRQKQSYAMNKVISHSILHINI